jgi:hypothetical protein
MSFLTKGGQLVTQGGKLVTTSEPANCKCCKPLFCELPYNFTATTSATNIRFEPQLDTAAGGKAGDIKKRLEQALALTTPKFTRWCCLPEPTGCSLQDDLQGGYSDFDGTPQEAETSLSASTDLDAVWSASTESFFFSGSHNLTGLSPAPDGEAGFLAAAVLSYSFVSAPPGATPMTLRNICDGTKKYTFSSNRAVGYLRVTFRYLDEDGNLTTGISEGLFYADSTYTVQFDYGGPPNQRKKLIEEESPLP